MSDASVSHVTHVAQEHITPNSIGETMCPGWIIGECTTCRCPGSVAGDIYAPPGSGVVFPWERTHPDDVRDRQRQQARQDAKRAMRLATAGPGPEGPKRARALGILRWFENRLACKGKGERDNLVYGYARHLGRYVNDGYLTRDEVCDAILAASRANGHMHGHPRNGWETNKSQAEIENDIARGLDVAARERTTVDWEVRFDD